VGVQRDHRHGVRGDVVQVVGDPEPLLRQSLLGLVLMPPLEQLQAFLCVHRLLRPAAYHLADQQRAGQEQPLLGDAVQGGEHGVVTEHRPAVREHADQVHGGDADADAEVTAPGDAVAGQRQRPGQPDGDAAEGVVAADTEHRDHETGTGRDPVQRRADDHEGVGDEGGPRQLERCAEVGGQGHRPQQAGADQATEQQVEQARPRTCTRTSRRRRGTRGGSGAGHGRDGT
jgi:hypothetical protein